MNGWWPWSAFGVVLGGPWRGVEQGGGLPTIRRRHTLCVNYKCGGRWLLVGAHCWQMLGVVVERLHSCVAGRISDERKGAAGAQLAAAPRHSLLERNVCQWWLWEQVSNGMVSLELAGLAAAAAVQLDAYSLVIAVIVPLSKDPACGYCHQHVHIEG